MSRSTAPVITSPLEAWPARPSPRTSPLSSKVSSLSSSPNGNDKSSRETSATSIATTMTLGDNSTSSASIATTMTLGESSKSTMSSQRSLGGPNLDSGSPMLSSVQTPPPRLQLVKGSLEDDPQSTGERSANQTGSGRRYAPPRRPLTPGQLGRIAQSFGIVIPSLPHPSPTSVSLSPFQTTHRSPLAMTRELRGTPWLVTVIPPFSILLPLLPASTPTEDFPGPSKLGSPEISRERERKKKWKRGRLLPLQPTMGSMLLSIAREYGLPSTQGVNLYLVHQPSTHLSARPGHVHSTSISSSGSFGSNYEEATGPQISAHTWSTLFASYLVQSASSSRASTPANTPLKSSGPLGRDIPFPPSPLSLADPPRPPHSKPSPSSSASSSSLDVPDRLPPTPHSLGQFPAFPQTNPIVGSIEFDVDPDQAGWYDDWRRTARQRPGHQRMISSTSDSGLTVAYGRPPVSASRGPGGMRQLNLVRKVNDGKGATRFLKEDAPSWTEKPRSMSLSATGSRPKVLRPSREERERERVLVQDSDKADLSSLLGPAQETLPEVAIHGNVVPGDLLASPIALDRQDIDLNLNQLDMDRVREVMHEALRNGEADKRGSGLVMADELDRLEQIMRNLSPREIRITSPRALTPRIAAKIAAARIQAESFQKMPSLSPNVPQHSSLLPSPLASGFTAEPTAPPAAASIAPVSYPSRTTKSSTDSASTNGSSRKLATGAWPAVPYASSPESPRIDEYFQPKLPSQMDAPSPRSAETLQRGQQEQVSSGSNEKYGEWRPARPRRPASPGLGDEGHQRNMSYTLPAGHVDLLRQNTTGHMGTVAAQAPMHVRDRSVSTPATLRRELDRDRDTREARFSPGHSGIGESPRSPPQPRDKRSGSISFKELRHQLSNRRWGEKTSPRLDGPDKGTVDKETIGLFRQAPAQDPSFISLNPSGDFSGPPLPAKAPGQTGQTFDLSPPLQMAEWEFSEIPSPPTHTFATDIIPLPSQPSVHAPLQSREPNSTTTTTVSPPGKAFATKILGGMNGFTFGKKPSISSLRQSAGPGGPGSRSISAGDSRPPVVGTGPGKPGQPGHTRTFSGSKSKSRRNPSGGSGSITISSPITSTFRQVNGTSPVFATGQLEPIPALRKDGAIDSPPFSAKSAVSALSGASGTSTELPHRSPSRQVPSRPHPAHNQNHGHGDSDKLLQKAVPVLGSLRESESFASSTSFVLEDPPRRRVR